MKKSFSFIIPLLFITFSFSQNGNIDCPLTLEKFLWLLKEKNTTILTANKYINLSKNELEIFESNVNSQHTINLQMSDNYRIMNNQHNATNNINYIYTKQFLMGLSVNVVSRFRTGNIVFEGLSNTPFYPNYSLNASYSLFSNELWLQETILQSRILNRINTRQNILMQKNHEAVSAYVTLYFYLEKLMKLNNILKIADDIYNISKQRFQKDIIDLENLLNSEINLTEIHLNIIQTESSISRILSELSILTSLSLKQKYLECQTDSSITCLIRRKFEIFDLNKIRVELNLDPLSVHPEINRLTIQKQINDLNIKLIERRYSSKLTLNFNITGSGVLNSHLQYNSGFHNFNHNSALYLNYSFPLFDSGLKRNNIEEYYIWNRINDDAYKEILNLKIQNINKHFDQLESIKNQSIVYSRLIKMEDIRMGLLTEKFKRNEIDLDYFLRKQQSYLQKVDRYLELIMNYFLSINNYYYESGDETILRNILFYYF